MIPRQRAGAWSGLRRFGAATLIAGCVGGARGGQPTIDSFPLAEAYGSGVHAYFSGDFDRSYADLTNAIEAGTSDPRAWYFRGLAALKLGRTDEAEADFSEAARREAEGPGAWPVGRALERVQGCDRLKLERHRVRGRVAALQLGQEAMRHRYSQIEDAQVDVLRRRLPIVERDVDPANPFEADATRRSETVEPAQPLPQPAESPLDPAPADSAEQSSVDAAPVEESTEVEMPVEANDPFAN